MSSKTRASVSVAKASKPYLFIKCTTAKMKIDPALLHRVAVIGSGTLDILPHNGAVVSLLAISGMTHRTSSFDIVMVGIVSSIAGLIAVIAIGSLFGCF